MNTSKETTLQHRKPFHFAGVDIQNPEREKSFDLVLETSKKKPVRVSWVYANCANILRKDAEYLQAAQDIEFVFNDGAGIEIASRVLGNPMTVNLCGTDWIPDLLKKLNNDKTPYSRIFLFGATEQNIQSAASKFPDLFPNLVLAGSHSGFFDTPDEIINALKQANAEVLVVGTGVPRQEKFLFEHWDKITESGIKVAVAGGAIIDHFAGAVTRAPMIWQKMRMEWLYRLLCEPTRLWQRYLIGNLVFFWHLFFDWIKSKKR